MRVEPQPSPDPEGSTFNIFDGNPVVGSGAPSCDQLSSICSVIPVLIADKSRALWRRLIQDISVDIHAFIGAEWPVYPVIQLGMGGLLLRHILAEASWSLGGGD